MDKIELLKQAIETGSEVVVVTGRAVPTEIYKNPDGKPFVRMSDGVSYSVDAYQFDVYSVATTIRECLAKSAGVDLRTTANTRREILSELRVGTIYATEIQFLISDIDSLITALAARDAEIERLRHNAEATREWRQTMIDMVVPMRQPHSHEHKLIAAIDGGKS